jgi:ParB family chromosome partitioning protein
VTGPADGKKLASLVPTDKVHEILLENLGPDRNQPRKTFSAQAIEEMAGSLKADGQLQPILVRWSDEEGKWVIVAGERRYRAALKAGMESLLCQIEESEMSKEDVLIKQLVENCLRENLRPIEQARAFKTLMDVKGWNGKRLARRLNIAPSAVSQALSLLELPSDIQEKVGKGEVSPSVAYEVTKLSDAKEQREVVEKVVTGKLSRKEVRETVKEKRG